MAAAPCSTTPDPFAVRAAELLQIWHAAPALQWTFNSLYLGVLSAVTVTFSSALVAFAFAYFRFPRATGIMNCGSHSPSRRT